jgi:hypothetical protein
LLSSVSIYYTVLVTKLRRSTAETDNKKNKKLIIANKELDKFLFTVLHTIFFLNSLQGLIKVMKLGKIPTNLDVSRSNEQ